MNRCPITYELCGERKYSERGMKLLNPTIKNLNDLELTQEGLLRESNARATKLSIQGVQPKLSARLNVTGQKFEIVDRNGTFIFKPQNNLYTELPENEDLTMRLAEKIGIELPLHGMIYSKEGKLTYFIKRFDRYGKNKKLSVEDFAQLAGMKRDTKYDFSMERLVAIIDKHCTFPALEKLKLFRITLFCYLTGNEDMHLKNFSLISREDKIELSPAYDLFNTTIAIANPQEEFALPLNGKKNNLTSNDLIKYWGKEKLQLSDKSISNTVEKISSSFNDWHGLIGISFLSKSMKEKYTLLLESRKRILFG
ncbi:MAG: HipA domain-containing protein [Bacteroidota bacterium]